jgi:hypothetical protein
MDKKKKGRKKGQQGRNENKEGMKIRTGGKSGSRDEVKKGRKKK